MPPVLPTSRGHTPATLMEGKNNQVRFVASRCRMSKRFSKDAGSVADPEIPTPRRDKTFDRVNSLQGLSLIHI